MKRFVSLGLVLIFAFHLAGFYCYFYIRMNEIHREMRRELALLPNEKLLQVNLPTALFQQEWLDEMEMNLDGRMYDIARIQKHESTMTIFCIHDESEDNLLKLLNEILRRSSEDSEGTPSEFLDFLELEYTCEASFASPVDSISTRSFGHLSKEEYAFDRVIDSPPPRIS